MVDILHQEIGHPLQLHLLSLYFSFFFSFFCCEKTSFLWAETSPEALPSAALRPRR